MPDRIVFRYRIFIFKVYRNAMRPSGLLSQVCHAFHCIHSVHCSLLCPLGDFHHSSLSFHSIRSFSVLVPSRPLKSIGCSVWLACDTHSAPCLSWFLSSLCLSLRKAITQALSHRQKHLPGTPCTHCSTAPSYFGLCVEHLVRTRRRRAAQ